MKNHTRQRGLRCLGTAGPALVLCFLIAACTGQEAAEESDTRHDDLAKQLQSLPYVTVARVREENRGLRGVVHHEPDRVHQGLNLYGSATHNRAHLRDMAGELVHTWIGEDLLQDRRTSWRDFQKSKTS